MFSVQRIKAYFSSNMFAVLNVLLYISIQNKYGGALKVSLVRDDSENSHFLLYIISSGCDGVIRSWCDTVVLW